jgi:predicted metallopeptidase
MPIPKNIIDDDIDDEKTETSNDGGIKLPKWSKQEDVKPIVSELIQLYPEHLAHIRPSRIGYVAFSKKKSKKLAFVAPVRPMFSLFTNVDYILATHIENWVTSTVSEKYLLIFHELLHIPPEGFDENSKHYRKTLDHDVKDFSLILQRFGINWEDADKIFKAKCQKEKDDAVTKEVENETSTQPDNSTDL